MTTPAAETVTLKVAPVPVPPDAATAAYVAAVATIVPACVKLPTTPKEVISSLRYACLPSVDISLRIIFSLLKLTFAPSNTFSEPSKKASTSVDSSLMTWMSVLPVTVKPASGKDMPVVFIVIVLVVVSTAVTLNSLPFKCVLAES